MVGEFISVGIAGYNWSGSSAGISSVNGSYLTMLLGGLHPYYLSSRGYGLPVRCVQELTVVFYIYSSDVSF